MRNTLLTIAIVMGGITSITAQTQIIDYPVTGERTTESLEFYRAEVSDTAVILQGDLYSRPDTWVSIAASSALKGRETGKSYRLVRATGITLDKKEFMPASWNRPFTLQFEPVDPRDKYVDFDEMIPGENGFRINGICLQKQQIKKKIHCHIQGKVVDNVAYSRLMLMPEDSDPRVRGWISIPVRDGKFTYDLYTDKEEPYELYAWSDNMSGAWRPVSFFSENGEIDLTLYSRNKNPEIHSAAPLTQELIRFTQESKRLFRDSLNQEIERLKQEDRIFSAEGKALHQQFANTKDDEEKKKILTQVRQLERDKQLYTAEYMATEKKSKEAFHKEIAYQKAYIQSTPTLVGLYLLMQQTQRMRNPQEDPTDIINTYRTLYANRFPGNYMTEYMQSWVESREIKVGGKFIDFSAPDLNGVEHVLSKEIKGKIALIDLWASWCGPCRRTSLSMIPVYEAYKDKGFTIVGVARERQAKDMENALAKDGYPWLNLLELNDAGKIWEKYGVGNAGGCTYLIDKDGKILLIHPTAEEVKECLDKLL